MWLNSNEFMEFIDGRIYVTDWRTGRSRQIFLRESLKGFLEVHKVSHDCELSMAA